MNSDSVDLIYLDPPFNSKRMYAAPIGSKAAGASFKDMWSWKDVDEHCLQGMVESNPGIVDFIESIGLIHSNAMMAYATYMAQRLVQMRRVLKPTGGIYLHCDPTASHYLKLLMDEVFGKNNFRNEIIWYKGYRGTPRKRRWQQEHDTILFYSKTDKYQWNKVTTEYKDKDMKRYNKVDEKGNRYALIKRRRTNGEIYYGKSYPQGKLCGDVIELPLMASTSSERTGYPTQKPLALIKKIINTSSNKGGLVLDPFCGCATTCVAAQQLDRKWIGIDVEEKAAELVVSRLSGDAGLFSDFVHLTTLPERSDIMKVAPGNKEIKNVIYGEQMRKCAGCEVEMEIRHLEIDHIVPRSKGGGDYQGNYQLLCGNCNRTKGNRPMEFLRQLIAKRQKHLGERISFGV